jgi:type II secretory pathway pseudopilin PulG
MKLKNRRAFTILEIIIDTFIITAVFGVLLTSFILILNVVSAGKARTAATLLANEQMEVLRNLPYDELATQNGTILPQGNIPDVQTIKRSGLDFVLSTIIITVDDPYDGCAIPAGAGLYECTDGQTSPQQDLVPVDYKRIQITVTQPNKPAVLATLTSNAAAKAAETPSNTGMILTCVNNSQGLGVPGATVTITNSVLGVNVQGITNNRGCIFVANVPPDNRNGYHIVAAKQGYSTDFTTPRTAQNPNQVQPDVDVNAQQITIQNLSIDYLATLVVSVVNELNQPVSGIQVTATGTKITQFNPEQPKNVYNQTTNSSGVATFNNIEWDSYKLSLPAGYTILTTSPYQAVSVAPSSTTNVAVTATTANDWPIILNVSPTSGVAGQTVQVVIEGNNFTTNTTAKLVRSGYADVIPTTINVAANRKSITLTLNLAGVASGEWDIVINASGKIVTQSGGFNVADG